MFPSWLPLNNVRVNYETQLRQTYEDKHQSSVHNTATFLPIYLDFKRWTKH